MKSKNEKYLDDLLNSVTQKNTNHNDTIPSYENYTAKSESKDHMNMVKKDDFFSDDENEDVKQITELLKQADNNEIIDDSLLQMLDSFSTENGIVAPKIKVGADPVTIDTRDEEERQLDDAIANAEQLFSEKQKEQDKNTNYEQQRARKVNDLVENVTSDISEKIKSSDREPYQEEQQESPALQGETDAITETLSDQFELGKESKINDQQRGKTLRDRSEQQEGAELEDAVIKGYDINMSDSEVNSLVDATQLHIEGDLEDITQIDEATGQNFLVDDSEKIMNEADINLDEMFAKMDSIKEQSGFENQFIDEKYKTMQEADEKDDIYDFQESIKEPLNENLDSYKEFEIEHNNFESGKHGNIESIDKTENIESIETAGSIDNIENLDNVKSFDETISIENTESTDNAENPDNVENIKSAEGIDNAESIENAESLDNTKSTEDIESIDNTQNIENTESLNHIKSIDNAEGLDNTIGIENTESLDNNTESIKNAESIGKTESTEDQKNIDNEERTDSKEIKDDLQNMEDMNLDVETQKNIEKEGINETDIAELDALMRSLSEDNVDQLNNGENERNIKKDNVDSETQNDNLGQDGIISDRNEGTIKSDVLEADLRENEDDLFNGLTEDGAEENPDEKNFDEINRGKDILESGAEEQSLEDALSEHIDEADLTDESDEKILEKEVAANKVVKKKKSKTEKISGEKTESFFAKIFHSLFEPLEPEEEKAFAENNELASLSAENQQVLDELENEKKAELSEGKNKKEKAKKEKKIKEKKPPKPKKEKKEKPKKEPKVPNPEDLKPLKKIPPKKIIISFAFAITFGLLLMLPSIVLPERTVIKEAEVCYAQGDYWTAYKNLYGKTNLSEMDQSIYEKARAIARMQHFYKSYVTYTSMKKPVEALNSLMKGVSLYPEILKEAQATGDNVVENEVNKAYDNIKSALTQTYGISSDQSEKILALQDDTEYTIRLQKIAGVR